MCVTRWYVGPGTCQPAPPAWDSPPGTVDAGTCRQYGTLRPVLTNNLRNVVYRWWLTEATSWTMNHTSLSSSLSSLQAHKCFNSPVISFLLLDLFVSLNISRPSHPLFLPLPASMPTSASCTSTRTTHQVHLLTSELLIPPSYSHRNEPKIYVLSDRPTINLYVDPWL